MSALQQYNYNYKKFLTSPFNSFRLFAVSVFPNFLKVSFSVFLSFCLSVFPSTERNEFPSNSLIVFNWTLSLFKSAALNWSNKELNRKPSHWKDTLKKTLNYQRVFFVESKHFFLISAIYSKEKILEEISVTLVSQNKQKLDQKSLMLKGDLSPWNLSFPIFVKAFIYFHKNNKK